MQVKVLGHEYSIKTGFDERDSSQPVMFRSSCLLHTSYMHYFYMTTPVLINSQYKQMWFSHVLAIT